MKDAITAVIARYDTFGSYLDQVAITQIEKYFNTGIQRIQITEVINSKANIIIKEASAQLYEELPELLRPGGNSYTTRRYAACLRDIEYYLRYASYSLIAGNTNILQERVLNGLKETYNSLNVPLAPTIRVIQILQDIIKEEVVIQYTECKEIISEPFQYMINALVG
uniref:Allophycocyanin beta 18 subunit n=1 Tax=Hildenbrandia rubra TaxID=31481 RepID=A0A1C9CG11_9FLOR|nr:allophycocyanin beta 18 subunit [Hildenbrandia rubra]AOM67309.1 allophycocyanin beta 18 subunit [Hildenbrandia rubra]|eukprot:Plantae.Rhodophyta-Hildenbrandia_rubra.ctg2938.p1 GENE.Plantae.Rhodophyta-Hildenbrandia_rubra.ctg2938~~Plantae.Rhodophyta-Hildenbrandia_rubra.ctg2938.p1  ORF type:complete len:167 (-),score=3.72 Plantae.Rhodophyta-Hildenbrandia_rubra.ctg2938:872-1372(-)